MRQCPKWPPALVFPRCKSFSHTHSLYSSVGLADESDLWPKSSFPQDLEPNEECESIASWLEAIALRLVAAAAYT